MDGWSECQLSRTEPNTRFATLTGMPARSEQELIVVDGREVAVSNPRKLLFPKPRYIRQRLRKPREHRLDGRLDREGGPRFLRSHID